MMRTAIYTTLMMLSLLACSQQIEVGKSGLRTLTATCRDIRESNVVLLNRAEVTIQEKGNRTRDVEMLEKVKDALSLRKSHELDFSLGGLESGGSLQLDNVNVQGFVSAFGERLQQLINDPATNNRNPELKELAQQYIENKTLLNLLLLEMHIANLESDMISTLAMAIGNTETFGFDGKVYFHSQSLEAVTNKPLKTIISLGHDLIGTSISITEPEVLINGNSSTGYELESFEKGLWQLTFTPLASGAHTIEFTTYFIPEPYPSERYAFTGKFDLIIE